MKRCLGTVSIALNTPESCIPFDRIMSTSCFLKPLCLNVSCTIVSNELITVYN